MSEFRAALLLLLSIGGSFVCITAYSQVHVSSSNGAEGADGPRIYKALNTDLIFPKTFNSSENVISTTEAFVVTEAPSTSTTTTTTTTAQPPWPYNHRAETEPPAAPIFVTPASVDQEPTAGEAPQDESQFVDRGELTSTGRAVDYRTGYPFGQLLTPLIKNGASNAGRKRPQGNRKRPAVRRPSSGAVYAQPGNGYYTPGRQPSRAEQNKLRGSGQFSDRFAPGEGAAAGTFQRQHAHNNHNHNHNHTPASGGGGKVSAASDVVQSFVPAKNPYAFPPLNTNYPSPSDDPRAGVPSNSVTSYLPPASGSTFGSDAVAGYQYPGPSMASSGYQYPGPVKAAGQDGKSTSSGSIDDGNGDNDDVIGVLPASAMDLPNNGAKVPNALNPMDGDSVTAKPGDLAPADDNKPADDDGDLGDGGGDDMKPPSADAAAADGPGADGPGADYDPKKEYPTPPPGWLEAHPESSVPKPDDHDHDPHHDHDHDHHHDHPPEHVHDHHHEHDHLPDYSDVIQYPQGFPSFDTFHDHHPHIYYDDHDHFPHHHHHHVEPPPPPPPPPPTTEPPPPPPPEPAPEPRVKKYSYFYIGRKLWYIPLYFTVWFSFYVLWLILKSIARHKVNLPNHYVSRRSLPDYSTQIRDEYINDLTVSVLGHIDSFRQKYLT